ncbi:MAG TPA: cytochrome d ubiquinol oxidase subunit II [Noviherbaspirillum sp.]|jgi:cytochrome d ubiquinol oxidase subunit II|uniref:cytochrome d ubiquinol oxidase subunit II n=1 Tax=Noviherbaspirillum sp. TaxID=1926288 RepID=UPI002DDD179A|nr:cytochrome d ubiquinol oxidase subunit II [Noviherbaspirillum sp.]HEV2609048.1 cytochrome d ubiquinol oxidase subunit II [Noviherbaspirillum sp.]
MNAILNDQAYYLPIVLTLVLGAAVALYVVLDGFDLGIGILFPYYPKEEDRDVIMNSVAPFWDGNETWLVMGGITLWVGFPIAFAIILPAVYLPVLVLLLALIFRGVAFEFRWVAKPRQRKWDISFAAGSTLAAFAQGLVLGAVLQEIPIKDGQYAGNAWDWLTPFSLMCGFALVAGYALLGATWLMMKTEGEIEERARRIGVPLLFALLLFIGIVSVWTPLEIERIAERWFSTPNFYFLSQVPLATLLLAWLCWRGIRRGNTVLPFASAIGLFLLAFAGLIISNMPYMVPPSLTIWDAATTVPSQKFFLVGAAILLPMILLYTVFVFWVFRGKVKAGEGYH